MVCHIDIVTRAFSESLDKCNVFLGQKGICALLYFSSCVPKTVCQSEEEQIWNCYTTSLSCCCHFFGQGFSSEKMLKESLPVPWHILKVFLTCGEWLWNLYFSFWKTLIPPFCLVWIILSQLYESWLFSIWKMLSKHQRFVSWISHLQNVLSIWNLLKAVWQKYQLKISDT